MSFELEFSTVKATSAADALVASIEKIAPSLGNAATSLQTSTDKILVSLNAIRNVSRGVATDLAGIAASVASVQRVVQTEMEKSAAKQAAEMRRAHSDALRMNSEFDKARAAQAEKSLTDYNRQLKYNMDNMTRIFREAHAEKSRILAMANDSEKAAHSSQLRAEQEHSAAMQKAWQQRTAQQLADLQRTKRMILDAEKVFDANERKAEALNMAERQRAWRDYNARKLQEQKASHAAALAESRKHAAEVAAAERASQRQALQQQNQVFSQSTAGFRAAMMASGTSFGIFTSSTIVTAAAVYGLVASFKAAITEGAEFEDVMTRVLAVMEATNDVATSARVTLAVRELAETTRFTATETAEAALALAMAGLDANETIEALPATLNLAAIGMMDMGFSAEFLTAVMHEFRLEATNLGEVADVLARASIDSAIGIKDLGTALSYVGPVAAISNNSLVETVALIETMGNVGLRGSRAGTSMRRMIDDMIQPADDAVATMVRLGVSARDVNGEMYSLVDFMKQLAIAGADTKDMASLFDLTARSAAVAILEDLKKSLNETGDAFDRAGSKTLEYIQRNEQAANSAERLRRQIDDTLKGDVLMMQSALSEKALEIFDQLGPSLRQLVQGVTNFILAIKPETVVAFVDALGGVADFLMFAAKWGGGLLLLNMGFRGLAAMGPALRSFGQTAAASFQLAATGTMPLTAGANAASVAMGNTATNVMRTTAVMGGANVVTRALGAGLGFLSSVAFPLLIFGTIATAIYSYATAADDAMEKSIGLQAEMELEAQKVGDLAGKYEGLDLAYQNWLQREAEAKSNVREDYAAQLAEKEAALERLNTLDNAELLAGRFDGMQERSEAMRRLEGDIADLKIKIASVSESLTETLNDQNTVSASLREKEFDAAKIAEEKLRVYQQLLETTRQLSQLQPNSLAEDTAVPAGMDPETATDALLKSSERRLEFKQAELAHLNSMELLYVDRIGVMYEDSERYLLQLRQNRLSAQQHANTEAIDAELGVLLARRAELEQQAQAAINAGERGQSGSTIEPFVEALKELNERIRELEEQRLRSSQAFAAEYGKLGLQQIQLDMQRSAALAGLADKHDSVHAAQTAYFTGTQELLQVQAAGILSAEQMARAWAELERKFYEATEPVQTLINQGREKLALDRAQAQAQVTLNFTEVARLTLQQKRLEYSAEELAQYANLLRAQHDLSLQNKLITDEAESFQRSWEQAVDRVDQSFEDLWKSGFRGFEDFREKLQDGFLQLLAFLAHQAITKPILVNLGLTASAFGAGGGGGGTGVPGSGGVTSALTSILPGFASTALSGVGAGVAGLLSKAGWVTATQAGALNIPMDAGKVLTGGNILKTGLYGAAGGWAGTKIGESLFDKQAESAWGASIIGTVGGIMGGPIGAALGAAIGGLIDAATGGDGKKRFSAGFSVGAPAVKDRYEYGTTTFDSGLTVTNIARRVEQGAADKVINYFKTLDSTFASVTRGAGFDLDLRGFTGLRGTTADAGIGGPGSFFGLKDYNGLGDEEVLKAQGVDFVKQLIAHVTANMSEDVRNAVNSATGSAEEILTRYQDVLSLDQFFRSGNKVFTNIDSFGETLELLDSQYRLNSESVTETAARIMQANEALSILGIGDGSTDSATLAMQLAEAAGGVENFAGLVSEFVGVMAWEEETLESSVERLRNSVTKQFTDLGLDINDFDLTTFKTHFESVKDSVSPSELVNLIRAGTALADLVEQEGKLADARERAYDDLEELLSQPTRTASSLQTLMASINSDLYELQGVTPLFEVTGTVDEQMDAIEQLRDQVMDRYRDEVKLEQDLHNERVDNYKALKKAAEQITDTLKDIALSDVSPLTSRQKRDKLLAEFNDLYGKAMGGDAEAAGKISGVAKEFLGIERERETINDTFLASYADITSRLAEVQGFAGSAIDPGKFKPGDAAAKAISELTALQDRLSTLHIGIAEDTLETLLDSNLELKNLPKAIADQLREVLGPILLQVLQLGQNFSFLSSGASSIATVLGLNSQGNTLSSTNVAQQVGLLSKLAEFPYLLGGRPLSSAVGPVLTSLANSGAPVTSIADAIKNNPALTSAWNEFAANNGYKSVDQYASKVNPNVSDQSLVSDAMSVLGNSGKWSTDQATRAQQEKSIVSSLIAEGVGSTQAANAWNALNPGKTPISSQDLNSLATKYGLPAFANGGLISEPTFGLFGEGRSPEYVAPVDKYAVVERQQIVRDITQTTEANNRALAEALDRSTAALSRASNDQAIHITVVTDDGTVLVEKTINAIRDRSENGEIVISAKGVKQR